MKKQVKSTKKSSSTMDRTPSASAGMKDSPIKASNMKTETRKKETASTSKSAKNKK